MSPEGDVFDIMAGRYSNNSLPNLGVYLKGHAGDDIRVNRVNRDRPPQFIHEPALTIGIAVQPDVLRGLVHRKGFRGRGLLARFLYSMPESLLGRRKVNTLAVTQDVSFAYRALIRQALRLDLSVSQDGSFCPHIVTVGSDALAELDTLSTEIERQLAPGGDLAAMGDWAGKLVGAVCRIAGIFHGLMYAGSGNPGGGPINAETMLGAIAIGEYLIPHARAAFFEMGADPKIDIAKKILDWASSEQIVEFSKRDAFNALRGTVQKVNELDDPISILVSHNYTRDISQDRTGPGRKPSPRYKMNPLWLAQNTHNTQNCPTIMNSAHSAQFAHGVTA